MSHKHNVERLSRSVHAVAEALPNAAAQPAIAEAADEPGQLARELIGAYAQELKRYRQLLGSRDEIVDPTQPADSWDVKRIVECPPEQVRLADLEQLERVDPEAFVARWREIRDRALRDLNNGWRAGRALEPLGGSAWERACFLAVRESLCRAYQPRNEGEAMLIDEMTQYEMIRQDWVAILAAMSHGPKTQHELAQSGTANDNTRRISALEATQEALRMVERMQRLYQNTLRTLLSLRRVRAPFIINHSAQVNVAVGQTA